MSIENIRMVSEERKIYDKKDLALAIRNSTFDDELNCSLLEEGVINGCTACNLKDICKGIDKVAEEHLKSTTKVVSLFNF